MKNSICEIDFYSIIAAELTFGVARRGTTHNYQALEMLLAPLTILAFDELATSAYGNLRADL